MRAHITDLVIETTRKCNMFCDHCLRGEPQNKVIEIRHVEKLFSKLSSIGTLTITGGEPSLHPEIIDQIVDLAEKYGVTIETFYMVTNARKVTRAFIGAIANLYAYCEDVDADNGIGGLSISDDGYHDVLDRENLRKLEAFRFTSVRGNNGGEYDPLNEGRAKENYNTGREIEFSKLNIYDDVIESDGDALIYLNCNGDILPNCNLSYESQSNNNLIVANVHERYFNLFNAVKRWNKRLQQLENDGYDEITADVLSEMAMVA